MDFENNLAFAEAMDRDDPLKELRGEFIVPQQGSESVIYMCGNSLGLQPKVTRNVVHGQLDQWANLAVEGWFEGEEPWMYYHKSLKELLAPMVGAVVSEVCPMNTLTVNLHLLLVSFYKPSGKRFKIIMEAGAFPSDQYALESQVRFHGYDPADAIIEVSPKGGALTLKTADIIAAIETSAEEIALVLFSGVNYFTGQLFDMEAITESGHRAGAIVGFDLAHAAGNVPLMLHDWEVDFACWCSYKYQNGGPGGISAIFVHEKHFKDKTLNRFAGWWGYQENIRFKMEKGFIPEPGADGWQVSCGQVIPMSMYSAALGIFKKAGFMGPLRDKSIRLTGYLYFIINEVNKSLHFEQFKIITPEDIEQRGAQLSIVATKHAKEIFGELVKRNILGDWREPNVIRLSPVPLYNTFVEIFQIGQQLLAICNSLPND
ncbi:kynureninase [Pedobacter duraquae]|nr:kynureninase [Pedobacter duraquae]